ncbi:MAG: hypothetical protein HZB52_04735 [Chloroflexi bacterium]|nr:hypothetical protein [Chloroflexota bacterium]
MITDTRQLRYVVRDATSNDLKMWLGFLEKKRLWDGVAPETKKQAESAVKSFGEALRSRTGKDIVWVFFSLRRHEAKGWKQVAVHLPHVVMTGHGVAPWHCTDHEWAQRGWGVASYRTACEVAKKMNFSQLFWLSSSKFYHRRGARVVTELSVGEVMCAELAGVEVCTDSTCPLTHLCNHALK